MRAIMTWLTAYLSFLCCLFEVTPDSLRQGRRGNLPPASGGFVGY